MERDHQDQQRQSRAAGNVETSADHAIQAKSIAPPPFRVTANPIQKKESDSEEQTTSQQGMLGKDASSVAPPPINPLFQAKYTVGAPDDHYEREADSVADKVVSQINTPQVQQKEGDESIQTKLETPTITSLQRSGSGGEGTVSDEISSNIESSRGGGSAMPADVQAKMGDAMGADFSGVRIHNNSNADTLNRSVNARAFTTGQDIFFKQNEYNPSSSDGQHLLAHELTHVVQQNSGVVSRKVLQRDDVQMPAETVTSSRQGVDDARQRARTAADVKTRSLGYITRHQQLVNEAVENFKVDAQGQITAMDGDPSDMWGLVPTLVGTAAAVVGTLFPPAAIGLAIVAGIQAAAQTSITAGVKSERGDAKEAARAALNSFALSVSNRQSAAMSNIERALDTTIEQQLMWDYDLRDLMLRGDSAAIDDLCSRIHVPNPTARSPFTGVLRGLTSDFSRWMARQAFHQEHGGTGFWDMIIDAPGTDLNRDMRRAENNADRQAQERATTRILEHEGQP
jgi:hypothetical protein